jgi:hypothetical protein
MEDERQLSKAEAVLGLSIIACLLLGLLGAYIYRFDETATIVGPDPSFAASEPVPARAAQQPVEQVSYRPVWLEPQGEAQPAVVR